MWRTQERFLFALTSNFCSIPKAKTELIDFFTDTAAILNSVVPNSYYGMLRGQISMYLPPGHPIIDIWNNRIQNGRRIGKKVYWKHLKHNSEKEKF